MYNPIEKKGKSLMIASEEDADYNKHASLFGSSSHRKNFRTK